MKASADREDFDPVEIEQILRSGNWVVDTIFPKFHLALIEALSSSNSPPHLNVPTCFLSAGFYREKRTLWHETAGGQSVNGHEVEVIDSKVRWERDFWEEALRVSVSEEARLSEVGERDLAFLAEALTTLKGLSAAYRESLRHARQFVVFDDPVWLGSAQPHFAGAVFIRRSLLHSPEFLENVVHELAHQELFCLNLLDRLVTPEADDKWVHAPFQGRERPTIGRLHAAHSIYRVAQFYELTKNKALPSAREVLKDTIKTFERNDLTPFGLFLTRDLYPTVM